MGFSVYLPPPLILIRVWSWLGQGKRGEGGQASVFDPSGYEPFTLVSNLWWERGGREKHSWGGLVGGHPEQARAAVVSLVVLGLVTGPTQTVSPWGQKATRGLNKYNIFIWHWVS